MYEKELILADRALVKKGLIYFLRIAWKQIEPAKVFISGWHIDAICDHLEAVVKGYIPRLLISLPPSFSKSIICSVAFPAWVWTNIPGMRFIYASHADELARRDSLRTRELIYSNWYQDRWGYIVKPQEEYQWTGTRFSNTAGGVRQITTIGRSIVGEHGDIQLVDDPHKPQDLYGSVSVAKAALERVYIWWTRAMASRITGAKVAKIIVAQRLLQRDLIGAMLETNEYEYLCLPMSGKHKKYFSTSIFEDKRKGKKLLCEERYDEKQVAKLKKEMGSRAARAQLEQDPVKDFGNIFKPEHFENRYKEIPNLKRAKVIQSWDCAFGKSNTSSFVVGQIWAKIKSDYYLLDQRRKRLSFTETCAMINSLSESWEQAKLKLIEKKANGEAVVDLLMDEIPGFKLINPIGGKEARANAVEFLFSAGQVYLPDESIAPWITDWIEEMKDFPAGNNDDQVDACTQALCYLSGKKTITDPKKYLKAMEKIYG